MKSVDLFAGAGGLSCGLKQSGFTPLLANELVSQYAETYQLNHQETQVIVGDVREICEVNIRKLIGVEEGEVVLVDRVTTALDYRGRKFAGIVISHVLHRDFLDYNLAFLSPTPDSMQFYKRLGFSAVGNTLDT